jgi:hypothetical protein
VDGGEEEEEGEKAEDTGPLRAGREEEAEEDVGAMVAPLSAVGVTAAAPGVEEEEGGEGGRGRQRSGRVAPARRTAPGRGGGGCAGCGDGISSLRVSGRRQPALELFGWPPLSA